MTLKEWISLANLNIKGNLSAKQVDQLRINVNIESNFQAYLEDLFIRHILIRRRYLNNFAWRDQKREKST